MKYGLLFPLLTLGLAACAQAPAPGRPGLNLALKRTLDSLFVRDQLFRAVLFAPGTVRERDALARQYKIPAGQEQAGLSALMLEADSSDLHQVRAFIDHYGYPGKTLVGSPTNEVAFYVIQHSGRIGQYLPLIRRAAEQGELPFRLYAMMLDRQLMQSQQPQVYGSQGYGFMAPNPATHQPEPHLFIWPIQDPARVNERRRQAGFDLTVEQNAQRLGIPYQVLTIDEVLRMPGYPPAR